MYKKRVGTPHAPLRTVAELAAEFGIKPHSLRAYIIHHKGPTPVKGTENSVKRIVYYHHKDMQAWWKELQPKIVGDLN